MVLDLDRVLFQRARELDAAARHLGMRGLGRSSASIAMISDAFITCCLGDGAAGLDRRTGARTALEQAALDQHDVRAFAGRVLLSFLSANVRSICASPICLWHDPPPGRTQVSTR